MTSRQGRTRRRLVANQEARAEPDSGVSVIRDNALMSYDTNGFQKASNSLILSNGYKDLTVYNH